jgi:hypothetical protein
LQPGGHRFDPGQLHQKNPDQEKPEMNHMIETIASLGGLLVPISVFVVGGAIAITAMILKHQERIAKIERGIDPDAPQR